MDRTSVRFWWVQVRTTVLNRTLPPLRPTSWLEGPYYRYTISNKQVISVSAFTTSFIPCFPFESIHNWYERAVMHWICQVRTCDCPISSFDLWWTDTHEKFIFRATSFGGLRRRGENGPNNVAACLASVSYQATSDRIPICR